MSPMRTSYWTTLAVGILYMCSVADAQLKPRPVTQTQIGVWGNKEMVAPRAVNYRMPSRALYAQGTGFNNSVQRPKSTAQTDPPASPPPPVVNVPAPVVNVAPAPAPVVNMTVPKADAPVVNVSGPAATMMDEIKSWLNTGFAGGIFATLLGFFFKKSGVPVVGAPVVNGGGVSPISSVVAQAAGVLQHLKETADDPAIKARADAALATIFGSDIVRGAVRTGLGTVPVAGGILQNAEPLINKAFNQWVEQRLAVNTAAQSPVDPPVDPAAPATPVAMSPAPETLVNLTNVIGSLKDLIDKRFPHA